MFTEVWQCIFRSRVIDNELKIKHARLCCKKNIVGICLCSVIQVCDCMPMRLCPSCLRDSVSLQHLSSSVYVCSFLLVGQSVVKQSCKSSN